MKGKFDAYARTTLEGSEGALASPEFGCSEKRTEREIKSLT